MVFFSLQNVQSFADSKIKKQPLKFNYTNLTDGFYPIAI